MAEQQLEADTCHCGSMAMAGVNPGDQVAWLYCANPDCPHTFPARNLLIWHGADGAVRKFVRTHPEWFVVNEHTGHVLEFHDAKQWIFQEVQ